MAIGNGQFGIVGRTTDGPLAIFGLDGVTASGQYAFPFRTTDGSIALMRVVPVADTAQYGFPGRLTDGSIGLFMAGTGPGSGCSPELSSTYDIYLAGLTGDFAALNGTQTVTWVEDLRWETMDVVMEWLLASTYEKAHWEVTLTGGAATQTWIGGFDPCDPSTGPCEYCDGFVPLHRSATFAGWSGGNCSEINGTFQLTYMGHYKYLSGMTGCSGGGQCGWCYGDAQRTISFGITSTTTASLAASEVGTGDYVILTATVPSGLNACWYSAFEWVVYGANRCVPGTADGGGNTGLVWPDMPPCAVCVGATPVSWTISIGGIPDGNACVDLRGDWTADLRVSPCIWYWNTGASNPHGDVAIYSSAGVIDVRVFSDGGWLWFRYEYGAGDPCDYEGSLDLFADSGCAGHAADCYIIPNYA